jgi:hypothetical protein
LAALFPWFLRQEIPAGVVGVELGRGVAGLSIRPHAAIPFNRGMRRKLSARFPLNPPMLLADAQNENRLDPAPLMMNISDLFIQI